MAKAASKKILIVDDEKDLVETLKVLLESENYEVIVAFDGKEGLQKAKEENPDLILMDVLMPHLNGYQVCRELKKDPHYKHIPIVMLTAKTQETDRFWGIESGADEYLTKPFESDALLSTLGKKLK